MSTNVSDSVLAKGVIGAFQAALQDLYKVASIANACNKPEDTTNEIHEETKEAFLHIGQYSTEEESSTFVEDLKNMSAVTQDAVDKIEDNNIKGEL